MKKHLFLFSFAALLVFGACNNNTEEAVEDTICYEVVEEEAATEDGLELMTDVATLEGEWFMAHCATTRIILFNDGTLVTVNVNGDGMVEGTYYLKNGRITMRDGYGNEIEGLVKADRNGIYLDLQKQVGWFVEADPSDQTDLSALGYNYGYNCSCAWDGAPMDEYRWMEGRWKFTYAGSTTELRIGDFGDGLWMMTYWNDGTKVDEGTIEVYDGAIQFQGKRLGGLYFPIDEQRQSIYADSRKTQPFKYAGGL